MGVSKKPMCLFLLLYGCVKFLFNFFLMLFYLLRSLIFRVLWHHYLKKTWTLNELCLWIQKKIREKWGKRGFDGLKKTETKLNHLNHIKVYLNLTKKKKLWIWISKIEKKTQFHILIKWIINEVEIDLKKKKRIESNGKEGKITLKTHLDILWWRWFVDENRKMIWIEKMNSKIRKINWLEYQNHLGYIPFLYKHKVYIRII